MAGTESRETVFNNCSLSEIFSRQETGDKKGEGSSLRPMRPAWYSAEESSWYSESDYHKANASQKKKLVPCTLLVQVSPTGRAKCRRCGEAIEKGVLRFSYPFQWRPSEDAYSCHLHLDCYVPAAFGIKSGDDKAIQKQILGWSSLTKTEQAQVKRGLRGQPKKKKDDEENDGTAMAERLSSGGVGNTDNLAAVRPPKELKMELLPFQKEGLAWMCRQEDQWAEDPSPKSGFCRGGVLADEMGMGKTIQTISLLLARPRPGPTLVVVPMAAVTQWVTEIGRYTKEGTFNVLIYHGATKKTIARDFKSSDIVLTTYQSMETDYRREMDKLKVACKYCGRKFLPEKLAVHQRYFCGPTAVRTLKLQKTQRKDKLAAVKGMRTMGIIKNGEELKKGSGSGASSSKAGYKPPTITNIYKETMAAAGVNIKANGYWNVVKEASARAGGGCCACSSGSCGESCGSGSRSSKKETESLTRERLGVMNVPELQAMCEKRNLSFKGKKEELVNRLSIYGMQQMGSKVKQGPASAAPTRTEDLSKSDLLKMKVADLQAEARKLGIRKAEVEDSSKKDLVELMDARLTERRAGGGAKRQASPGAEMPGAKRKKSGEEVSSSSAVRPGGFARTVAAQRRTAAPATPAKGGKGKKQQPSGKACKPAKVLSLGQTDTGHDISGSPLHNFAWSRIILDEGHRIKGRTNSTAMAAYQLRTTNDGYRWCLTGTPLQNRVGELYSLVRFLEFRPYAYYYCKAKGCECERCTFMRGRYCPDCGHNRMFHYSYFKGKISNPIIKFGFVGAGKEAFKLLQTDILNKVMLRRTKEQKKDDMNLPPLKVLIRRDKLSAPERDFYESIFKQSQVNFGTYVSKGTLLHNYAHIFDLLTSLRRAVDHPYLIIHGNAAARHAIAGGATVPQKVYDTCGLCQDDIEETEGGEEKVVSKCGHSFHKECVQEYMRDAPKTASGVLGCPVCYQSLTLVVDEEDQDDEEDEADDAKGASAMKRKKANGQTPPPKGRAKGKAKATPKKTALPEAPAKGAIAKTNPSILQKFKAAEFSSSTKIEALADEVTKMRKEDKTAKALVFSQFGAMLEICEFRLKRAGFNCVMYRGGMTMQARGDAISAFNTDPSLTVILISLKAGGEGLNLQAASHVFLMDPWWNPACELQAIQRAHRIGQKREVKAVRFITEGTIEEKILALQEKKQLVFDGTIGGSKDSISKLTEQDLHFLFQH